MPTRTPDGYTTVAPWIVTRDTGHLLAFVTSVFDGVELGRVPLEDGTIGHAEIRSAIPSFSPSTSGRDGLICRASCVCSSMTSTQP